MEIFADRIAHVHAKDVSANVSRNGEVGVFGGNVEFGDLQRFWNFRSIGRGQVDFERMICTLNMIGYNGPLSIEWEDSLLDRVFGAKEARKVLGKLQFEPSDISFDGQFDN